MEFCRLVESYGHVVYENKKVLKKKFQKNIFASDKKISVENFWHFSVENFDQIFKKKTRLKKNVIRKKKSKKKFLFLFFDFRKLHEYSFPTSYWTLSNSF